LNKPALLYYEILDFQRSTLEYINKFFDLITLPDPDYDFEEILRKTRVIFAPMGFVFDKYKIDKCPNLQIIGSPTTGIPHIDVDYATKRNISICSLKNQQSFLSTITPTAELAWGLLLAVTRQIPGAHDSVCEGKWIGREFGRRTPRMLSAMTLGVVGLGRLGSMVARYGRAFKMNVIYYDPFISDNEYTRCDNLYDLAHESNIVSVHVHLTEETENLIDRRFLQSMPEGSFIINTARGGIVDEDSLLEALQTGHLAGAGLDMLAGEHLPGFKKQLSEYSLVQYARNHDNLIITPKIGGCTMDAWEITERHIVDLVINELNKRKSMKGEY
jgi:phosphoglycerate dehydrogenase-like enzyme